MQKAAIKIGGRLVEVPSTIIGNRTVVLTGRWLHTASVKSEDWLESEAVSDPPAFISALERAPLNVDILTFAQRPPNLLPRWDYPMGWDNLAAIPLADGFKSWWEERLPQEARKNARRAAKRGVTTRAVQLTEDVICGIMEMNNESPVVQGKPSRHYGKDFATVKADYSSFPDRSDFIAAYCGEELIGLVWLVRMGQVMALCQLCTKAKHYDKRPANALIEATVKFCCQGGYTYLTYGKYVYGKNTSSSLTEFKRRIGFEQILVPRYYVPFTAKGQLALRLNVHLGLKHLLPKKAILLLVRLRSKYYELRHGRRAKSQDSISPKSRSIANRAKISPNAGVAQR